MTHTTTIALLATLSSLLLLSLGAYIGMNYPRKGTRSLGVHFGLWAIAAVIFPFRAVGQHIEILSQYVNLIDIFGHLWIIGALSAAQFSWLIFILCYTTSVRNREILFVISFAVISTIGNVLPRIQNGAYVPNWFVIDLISDGSLFVWAVSVLGIPVYGLIRLVKLSEQQRGLSRNAAFLLSIPAFGFVLAFIVFGLSNIPRVKSFSLIGFVAFLCGTIAVSHYEVLEQRPVSHVVGRDTALDVLDTGIIVLDNNNRISDANPAAEQLLGTSTSEMTGAEIADVLPETVDLESLLNSSQTVFEAPQSNRVFRARTATASDKSGRNLGETISIHDITEERRRQQRIQVLNRVLRHNLRNDLDAVDGYAELLEEETSESAHYASRIQRLVSDLISTGEKAREIEKLIATEQADDTEAIDVLVDEVVEKVQQNHPHVEVSIDHSDTNLEVDAFVLSSVLQELIENACRHNDSEHPSVMISVDVPETDQYAVAIQVSDNGPGIPEYELAPIRKGSETSLEHGSGLGLWLVKWGVGRLNGAVEFTENDPEGTVATIYV